MNPTISESNVKEVQDQYRMNPIITSLVISDKGENGLGEGITRRISGFKIWLKSPLNIVVFLWITCVAISGAILFLVVTGMLDCLLTKKAERDAWFEANNQILNALFTLMCLYQHPNRFHSLVLLCQWKQKDVTSLRELYCKNGTRKPHERFHVCIVIVLLHLNCFAQYALCGLNLGYKRTERPALGVAVCLSLAIAAPAIAALYCLVSPLGKDRDCGVDEEAQDKNLAGETRWSNEQDIVEESPQWKGGLFDPTSCCVSFFCMFCVFGRNMERLGLGNKYVHMANFVLFCTAPFIIFHLAAKNLDHNTIREAFTVAGIALCFFGLLYGGFWRIRTRETFGLPANRSCCGDPEVTDCAQWLFCCWCSLAQEVRTVDFYDVVEGKLCKRRLDTNDKSSASRVLSTDDVAVSNVMKPPTIALALRKD